MKIKSKINIAKNLSKTLIFVKNVIKDILFRMDRAKLTILYAKQ